MAQKSRTNKMQLGYKKLLSGQEELARLLILSNKLFNWTLDYDTENDPAMLG
jgi:hypothetical protein